MPAPTSNATRSLRRLALLLFAVVLCAATGVAVGATATPATPPAAADPVEQAADDAIAGVDPDLADADDAVAITPDQRVGSDIRSLVPPPKVTAKAWLVQDALTDETVAAQLPSTPRPIASLAKLMTALVVLDTLQPGEVVTVPAVVNTLPADAAVMGLRAGEKWPAEDLMRAMLVYSANDAALALAANVTKGDIDAFVGLMNDKAEELELDDSRFTSPTGLDVGGVESTSSPIDLAELARNVYLDPVAKAAMRTPSLTLERPSGGEPIVLANRNPLIGSYTGVDGVKTGFTDQAGYMLISHQVDAETRGEWFVVTAGSSTEATRKTDNAALLDWIRPFRVDAVVASSGVEVATVPVLRSTRRVHVFVCDDLTASVRVGQRLQREIVLPEAVEAPISAGDEIGELRVQVGDADARSVKLCSSTDLPLDDWRDHVRSLGSQVDDAWRLGTDEVRGAARRVTGGRG